MPTTEVALLQWSPGGGVRLLGKSNDPEMVDTVRRHLVGRLDEAQPADGPTTQLRLVQPVDSDERNQP